ncbi:MAG: hypothetical protein M1830_008937 [Pleopsidium flavum]|nr:MAG: hypothetical protein M1830_008937 [Pleopsidium flavum]
MADALCGPSNPLQNFQKHTAADRTLQQDRLTAQPSHRQVPILQSRSSPGPNAGILDAEFEAFQAGFSGGAALPELQQFPHASSGIFRNGPLPPTAAPGWASDFQQLQISSGQLPTPQYHFSPQTSLPRTTPGGWQGADHQQYGFMTNHANANTVQTRGTQSVNARARNDLTELNEQELIFRAQHTIRQSIKQAGRDYQLQLELLELHEKYSHEAVRDYQLQLDLLVLHNKSRLRLAQQEREVLKETGGGSDQSISITKQNEPRQRAEVVLDDAAFERAFEAARLEMQHSEFRLPEQHSIRNSSYIPGMEYHLQLELLELHSKSRFRLAQQEREVLKETGGGSDQSISISKQNEPRQRAEDVLDDAAFERAFEAARSEMQHSEQQWRNNNLELGQDVLINESAERLLQSDHLLVQERIGADTISQETPEGTEEHQQSVDSDELARTAGELLDSVKYNQSQKFQESNFLGLMRRLRDREVRVEADKMVDPVITLSASRDPSDGSSVAAALTHHRTSYPNENEDRYTDAPPHSPIFCAPSSSSASPSPRPPPFSSLYFPSQDSFDRIKTSITETDSTTLPAFAPTPSLEPPSTSFLTALSAAEAETKAALPADTKGESSSKSADDGEPPPPYTEGSSPLDSFTYVMAAAGGAASIITQVQQGGGPPINTLGDVGADEHITLDLRGTRFTLSRDELLTLPEFVLLSLFPNGLLPDGHMNSFHEGDIYPVDVRPSTEISTLLCNPHVYLSDLTFSSQYDPASLQYMLDFFRNVAQTIPSDSPSPTTSPDDTVPIEPVPGSARDMLQDRAGIIVLREDLDFYAIPPRAEIEQPEMIEVKRAAGKALLKQDGIFSGLRRSEETGTTEQHLIEMLTAGGFNNDDRWGHRASEPNKAVICSLALARLRTDIKGNDLANSNAVGMAQKLLLFWRKPARRCWWEGVELDNVDGVEGRLKVWIRRVWTLEMSVIGLR